MSGTGLMPCEPTLLAQARGPEAVRPLTCMSGSGVGLFAVPLGKEGFTPSRYPCIPPLCFDLNIGDTQLIHCSIVILLDTVSSHGGASRNPRQLPFQTPESRCPVTSRWSVVLQVYSPPSMNRKGTFGWLSIALWRKLLGFF